MLLLLILISTFVLGGIIPSCAQIYNRPVPSSILPYSFDLQDSTFQSFCLLSPFHTNNARNAVNAPPMILDRKGYLAFYLPAKGRRIYDFKYFRKHHKYAFLSIKNFELTYEIYDEHFNLIDTLKNTPTNGSDVHEFQILDNGHYLIGGYQIDTVNLSRQTFGNVAGSPKTPIKGFVIEEFNRDHQLVFSWNSNQYIDPLDAFMQYGYNSELFNYCHGNAIEQDFDGNFLISFRHLNSVYKISRTTGAVIWRLGGKRSDYTFPDDTGFSGQHDIRRIENGNITLFDNGNTASPQVSRAVEYNLDTINWRAELVWEYVDSCEVFAKAMGNHQTTAKRQHLVNYGLSYRPNQSISLVNESKEVLFNIYFEDSVATYRSYISDLPIAYNRPEIIKTNLNKMTILSAPPGHLHYEWSTGAYSRSIFVATPGTYQVWVDHNNIMIGSNPIIIQESENPAFKTKNVSSNSVIAIYNILGKEVLSPTAGELYFIAYNDRTYSKLIF